MNLRIPRSGQAAKIAQAYLATQGIDIAHSQALELVARLHGYESWQAMRADKRFDGAPALKPASSVEYEFCHVRGSSVWLGIENISVYVRRGDEGVSVDLFARDCEDQDSLVGTWLPYDEAQAERDERNLAPAREPARW